ncbi:MAG: fasciclin domain-containing protein [Paludibacter sp.]|nr:fasciclin domain-containing protein [Paludibacter sp.]
MKKMKFSNIILTLLLLIVTLSSCSDVWDNHYNTSLGNKSSLNLYEYIQAQSDLSVFSQMIKISGYDTILNKYQTYTVWAPVNSALQNVNLSDIATVTEIVKNHISRFSYPTSNISSKTIYMIDKKFLTFKRSDTGFTFGGISLIQSKSNIATKNGILHVIDGFVPYSTNIFEFIGKTVGLDSLKAYLYSQNTYKFDLTASVEIGTNSHGQAVYDSVITFNNEVLNKIGHLYLEDSTFTAILPNNTAWTKAYNSIKSNYNTLAKDGGVAQQRLNTQMALVRNLVFRNIIADPSSLDSLITTTGTVFQKPDYLFFNTNKTELSNGIAYVTDSIRFKAGESWQQKIQLEAENSSYGRSYLYANLYVRSSLGSSLGGSVSQNKYLVIEPNTPSNITLSTVTFPIPNTLSGKYNIYCMFVPASIVSSTDLKPNKIKFYLSYLNNSGVQITDAPIDQYNAVLAPGKIGYIFTTEALKMSKMFVTQFKFPYCNLYTDKSTSSDITVKLRVENAVKITETTKFNRTMRIDYLILEPVQ